MKKLGAPWLSRSVVSGSDKQTLRTRASGEDASRGIRRD
jgi:hypothetical protein